jgi:hypothetical protein
VNILNFNLKVFVGIYRFISLHNCDFSQFLSYLCILTPHFSLQTRIRKLDSGDYDAIVLAYAGLLRGGLAVCVVMSCEDLVFVIP